MREGREAERRPIGLAVRAREALNLLHRRLGRRAELQREVGLAWDGRVRNETYGDGAARAGERRCRVRLPKRGAVAERRQRGTIILIAAG